jgi:hypothetical protein
MGRTIRRSFRGKSLGGFGMNKTVAWTVTVTLVWAVGIAGPVMAQATGTTKPTLDRQAPLFGTGIARPPNQVAPTTAPTGGFSALTTAECTALGGRVTTDNAACTNAGNFTCTTVTADKNGKTTVNTACIDRK